MTIISLNSARFGLGIAAAILCLTLPLAASAQNKSVSGDMMPALSTNTQTATYGTAPGQETHPSIKLAPDKTEIVKLDDDADSIIIGNPAHLNIMMNSSRTLLLAARQPGATQFIILNREGKVIMQRHVIVSGPQEKYLRIRRRCNVTGVGACDPTSVYYCPAGSMCHDVQLLAGQSSNNSASGVAIPSDAATTDSGDSDHGSAPYDDENDGSDESSEPADDGTDSSTDDSTAE